jgi:hypothetical protein
MIGVKWTPRPCGVDSAVVEILLHVFSKLLNVVSAIVKKSQKLRGPSSDDLLEPFAYGCFDITQQQFDGFVFVGIAI